MDRLTSIFVLSFACAACVGSHAFGSWPAGRVITPRTVCVYDATEGHELTVWTHRAMVAWGLFADGWDLSSNVRCDGVSVEILDHASFELVRPSPLAVGVTLLMSYGADPVASWLDAEWWEQCPGGRQALVYHEIGHVAGYEGHAPGVMNPSVVCEPSERPVVDAVSRRRAAMRRARR